MRGILSKIAYLRVSDSSPELIALKAIKFRFAFNSQMFLMTANVVKLLVQFASIPIIAHFIIPTAYGLVALALPIIYLINIIGDTGVSNIILMQKESSPDLESTVFWVNISISTTISLLIALLCIPLGVSLHHPDLAVLIAALAPVLIFSSAMSVPNVMMRRDEKFSDFAKTDIYSVFLGAAVAIVAALNGFGVWTFVAQQYVIWVTRLLLVAPASGFRLRLKLDLALIRGKWGFGLNFTGANLLDFLSRNIDNMIIGVRLGAASLGYYSLAYQIMRIPEQIVAGPMYLTSLGSLLRLRDDNDAFLRASRSMILLSSAVIFPIFAGLALTADLAIPLMLGARWTTSARVMALLSPAGLVYCMYYILLPMTLARSRADVQFKGAMLVASGAAVGTAVGTLWGLEGVAIGISLMLLASFPVQVHMTAKAMGAAQSDLWSPMRPATAASAIMAIAVLCARTMLTKSVSNVGPITVLLACIAVGCLAYCAVMLITTRRQIMQSFRQLSANQRLAPA